MVVFVYLKSHEKALQSLPERCFPEKLIVPGLVTFFPFKLTITHDDCARLIGISFFWIILLRVYIAGAFELSFFTESVYVYPERYLNPPILPVKILHFFVFELYCSGQSFVCHFSQSFSVPQRVIVSVVIFGFLIFISLDMVDPA
jgi:hypothetical protein